MPSLLAEDDDTLTANSYLLPTTDPFHPNFSTTDTDVLFTETDKQYFDAFLNMVVLDDPAAASLDPPPPDEMLFEGFSVLGGGVASHPPLPPPPPLLPPMVPLQRLQPSPSLSQQQQHFTQPVLASPPSSTGEGRRHFGARVSAGQGVSRNLGGASGGEVIDLTSNDEDERKPAPPPPLSHINIPSDAGLNRPPGPRIPTHSQHHIPLQHHLPQQQSQQPQQQNQQQQQPLNTRHQHPPPPHPPPLHMTHDPSYPALSPRRTMSFPHQPQLVYPPPSSSYAMEVQRPTSMERPPSAMEGMLQRPPSLQPPPFPPHLDRRRHSVAVAPYQAFHEEVREDHGAALRRKRKPSGGEVEGAMEVGSGVVRDGEDEGVGRPRSVSFPTRFVGGAPINTSAHERKSGTPSVTSPAMKGAPPLVEKPAKVPRRAAPPHPPAPSTSTGKRRGSAAVSMNRELVLNMEGMSPDRRMSVDSVGVTTPTSAAAAATLVKASSDHVTEEAPRTNRRGTKELLTEEEKRANHIQSEQKRRNLIRNGFQTLANLVPGLKTEQNASLSSKSIILGKTVEFVKYLERRNREMEEVLEGLERGWVCGASEGDERGRGGFTGFDGEGDDGVTFFGMAGENDGGGLGRYDGSMYAPVARAPIVSVGVGR
ncbi:hypothetical protein BC829DRAFT_446227 [Chytridium lagenaria]|nr:hypothetical protein BC829DRAFT_446227 [Chytridium lagenaria]